MRRLRRQYRFLDQLGRSRVRRRRRLPTSEKWLSVLLLALPKYKILDLHHHH
jgi:hypothetical protein